MENRDYMRETPKLPYAEVCPTPHTPTSSRVYHTRPLGVTDEHPTVVAFRIINPRLWRIWLRKTKQKSGGFGKRLRDFVASLDGWENKWRGFRRQSLIFCNRGFWVQGGGKQNSYATSATWIAAFLVWSCACTSVPKKTKHGITWFVATSTSISTTYTLNWRFQQQNLKYTTCKRDVVQRFDLDLSYWHHLLEDAIADTVSICMLCAWWCVVELESDVFWCVDLRLGHGQAHTRVQAHFLLQPRKKLGTFAVWFWWLKYVCV